MNQKQGKQNAIKIFQLKNKQKVIDIIYLDKAQSIHRVKIDKNQGAVHHTQDDQHHRRHTKKNKNHAQDQIHQIQKDTQKRADIKQIQ